MMLNNLDYFIAFLMFLIFYGFYFKIWNNSRTTIIVFIYVFLLSVFERLATTKVEIDSNVLVVSALFLFLLFIRAVFRKHIQNSKYKDVFYA